MMMRLDSQQQTTPQVAQCRWREMTLSGSNLDRSTLKRPGVFSPPQTSTSSLLVMETTQEPLIPHAGEPLEDDAPEDPQLADGLTRHNDGKPRRTRSKWTPEETQDLIKGCSIHGVGSWKKCVQSHAQLT
jgi:Myb-like DNA-binding domain